MNLKLETPWDAHRKKIMALFYHDPTIEVGLMHYMENGTYSFDIKVYEHAKFLALDRLLDKEKQFGNVTLKICLYDMENILKTTENAGEVYKVLFRNNLLLKDVQIVKDRAGCLWSYVCFEPVVLQFFNDDLSDINGNWSGLAQDIAKDIFVDEAGVYFCTAALPEKGIG